MTQHIFLLIKSLDLTFNSKQVLLIKILTSALILHDNDIISVSLSMSNIAGSYSNFGTELILILISVQPSFVPSTGISIVQVFACDTYKYVCMYLCMYACMYVRMYVCMYVCMHVCMYVCDHTWTVHEATLLRNTNVRCDSLTVKLLYLELPWHIHTYNYAMHM